MTVVDDKWYMIEKNNPQFLVSSDHSDDDNTVENSPLIWPSASIKSGKMDLTDFRGSRRTELMTKNNRRNWRRLLAGGLAAIVILALLIAAIILLTGRADAGSSRPNAASRISLEEWLDGWLSTKSFNATWLNDDEIFYRDEAGNLVVYSLNNATSRILLPATNPVLKSSLGFDHKLSPDGRYLLVASNYQKFYRHTYLAQYTIINLATSVEIILGIGNSTTLQLATWAPKGSALVFVNQNNIYYRPEAEVPNDYQITTTGVFGSIYNAVPDWVYEEEIFSSNKALWFSPSGSKMVFGYFDDSKTPVMSIPYYGYPGSISFQYTSAIPIHYPKSGTRNPEVKLLYVDLDQVVASNGTVVLTEIQHPKELDKVERILAAVAFPTENLVSATWMNRVQNQTYIYLCNVENFAYNTALNYVEKHGWVEQFVAPHFSRNGSEFLLILPRVQLDNDSWSHVVMVSNALDESPQVRDLTSGTFVVTEIVGWDEDNSLVYYLATLTNDPAQQHFYRISTLDREAKAECLSCQVKSITSGAMCLYNDAKLSPDTSRYVLTCAGPSVPDISIYSSINATRLMTWEDNEPIAQIMAERLRPEVKRFTVPVAGFQAQVRLLLPPDADLSGATKYPMLVYVYGGPDTYQVTEKFNIDWGTYLVTNKNIIYAAIDGRGSGLKGTSMLFSGYRNLGTVEIYDQINVTRHLQKEYPFIDKTKTAIWGWSYGGYAAGMSLAMDHEDIFKCGISVAPVTDWTLYDSIYTERFMGLPTVHDNVDGYEQGQLLNKAANIKSNSYYLIHGTLDDNVHYQQSLLLAKVLEQKDILFRQQTYTDEDHGIGQTRSHLYHSMENFLDDCLGKS